MLLPPEVRNRIWIYALGGQTLHLSFYRLNRAIPTEKVKVSLCVAAPDDAHVAEAIRYCTEELWVDTTKYRHMACCLDGEAPGYKGFAAPKSFSLSLLRTCSQVYAETALIPFHTNAFAFDKAWRLSTFLAILYPAQRNAIYSLTRYGHIMKIFQEIKESEAESWTWNEEDLTGLKKLTVFEEIGFGLDGCDGGMSRESKAAILREYRDRCLKDPWIFLRSDLESVIVCCYRAAAGCTEPKLFNEHSENIEAKFFESKKTNRVEENVEAAGDH